LEKETQRLVQHGLLSGEEVLMKIPVVLAIYDSGRASLLKSSIGALARPQENPSSSPAATKVASSPDAGGI